MEFLKFLLTQHFGGNCGPRGLRRDSRLHLDPASGHGGPGRGWDRVHISHQRVSSLRQTGILTTRTRGHEEEAVSIFKSLALQIRWVIGEYLRISYFKSKCHTKQQGESVFLEFIIWRLGAYLFLPLEIINQRWIAELWPHNAHFVAILMPTFVIGKCGGAQCYYEMMTQCDSWCI